MKRRLIAVAILLMSFCSCQKGGECIFNIVQYLYAGGQGDNQFHPLRFNFDLNPLLSTFRGGFSYLELRKMHQKCTEPPF